jgi:ribosomal protein S27AE
MTALIRMDRSITPPSEVERAKPIRFCSRCGHPSQRPAERPNRITAERVCRRCGMGMMLTTSGDALPGTAAAFLIVTFRLRVSAVSEAAEKIFGPEPRVAGAWLLDLLTSPLGDDLLARSVAQAAQRACEPVVLPTRMRTSERADRVGTLATRIATCGPPRAALVTVEPSDFGRR